MDFISQLEKRRIITTETLKIFGGSLYFFLLGWYFIKINLPLMALGSFFIYFGGIANLYVIDFNSFAMPVAVKDREELERIKKKNPNRRICMLDKKTKMGILADRISIGKGLHSIGDITIYLGIALILLEILLIFI